MIKKIWDRVMNREVISYLICGVLTTLVNWIVYAVLVKLSVDYLIATAVAWAISVLFAFGVNKIFVFQSYNRSFGFVMRELSSFVACRAVSGVMEMVFMFVMVSWLHLDEYISKIFVSVFVMVVNYVFSKLFIFRKSEENPGER